MQKSIKQDIHAMATVSLADQVGIWYIYNKFLEILEGQIQMGKTSILINP